MLPPCPAGWALREYPFQGSEQPFYYILESPWWGGFWGDIQYVNTQGWVLGGSSNSVCVKVLALVISTRTAVRNQVKFDVAVGSAFSTRGRLEDFHTKKRERESEMGSQKWKVGT